MTVGQLEQAMTAREFDYWKQWVHDYERETKRSF